MATQEASTHPFPAQERIAQTLPFVDHVLSIVDRHHLTTSDWVDGFRDCRELGTILCLETVEDLCSRHYLMRLAEAPNRVFAAGLKKAAASVCLDRETRSGFGDRP